MAYEFATYQKQGRIAIVTINRPERMNALHPPANFELHEIWNDFERDADVWVGILTGAGDKAFSARNDLRFTAEHGRDMVRMAESGFGGLANRTGCWKPRCGRGSLPFSAAAAATIASCAPSCAPRRRWGGPRYERSPHPA